MVCHSIGFFMEKLGLLSLNYLCCPFLSGELVSKRKLLHLRVDSNLERNPILFDGE